MSAFDAILSSDENELPETNEQVTHWRPGSVVISWNTFRTQLHNSQQDLNAFNGIPRLHFLDQLLHSHKGLLEQYFSTRDDNSDLVMKRSRNPDPTLLELIDSLANVLRDHDEYWKQAQSEEAERVLKPLQDVSTSLIP
jgi:hypothetical protein